LKGEFVKEKSIKKLKILDEAQQIDTDFGKKVECHVSYDGQGKEDPDTWTMNNTTAKLMQKHFGTNSKEWINQIIPVEPSRTEKGYAIYLDETKLSKGTLD